jgi:PAS domain-containing protein
MLFLNKLLELLIGWTLKPLVKLVLRLVCHGFNLLVKRYFSNSGYMYRDLQDNIEGMWDCYAEKLRQLKSTGASPWKLWLERSYAILDLTRGVVSLWYEGQCLTLRVSLDSWLLATAFDGSIDQLQLVNLVENKQAAVIRLDMDVTIRYWGRNAAKLFLFDAIEVIDKSAFLICIPEQESAGRQLRPLIYQFYHDPELFRIHLNENIDSAGKRMSVLWLNLPSYEQGQLEGLNCYGVRVHAPMIAAAVVWSWRTKVWLQRWIKVLLSKDF